jgi:hypothetical protein
MEDSAMHIRSVPVIHTVVAVAIASTVACGATSSNPAPVSTPQSTSSGTTTAPSGPTQVNASDPGVIPVGQELDVRLQAPLSSETATVEQRFEATTAADVVQNGRTLIPAGSIVRGVVSDVKRPGRIERQGSLTLSFDQIVVRGREYQIRGLATQVFESGGIREEVGTVGAGAGVGGVIGGLIGGVKGALLGAVIGAGGAIAATEGKDISLPAGSIVRIRFDTPLRVG